MACVTTSHQDPRDRRGGMRQSTPVTQGDSQAGDMEPEAGKTEEQGRGREVEMNSLVLGAAAQSCPAPGSGIIAGSVS